MNLETGEIGVWCLDVDGLEVCSPTVVDNLKEAKKKAKLYLTSEELKDAGLYKAEVRDHKGECLADYFV